jgi:uncharacterized alkaline shock family protein YloU
MDADAESSEDAGTERRPGSSAFPFSTDNPSGVPGITEIESDVIAAIAGHVVMNVEGVARLGATGGIVRAVADTIRSRSSALGAGIDVEAGRKEAILDIDLIVIFGHNVPKVVQNVREAVAKEIHNLIGLVAKEINVSIVGIEFPDAARRRVE